MKRAVLCLLLVGVALLAGTWAHNLTPRRVTGAAISASASPASNHTLQQIRSNQSPVAVPPTAQSLAAAVAAQSREAVTTFSNWTARFLAGDPSANLARGEALAWKRREAMRELIQTDPEQALALAAPFGWRTALPANIMRHFEKWVDARGELFVMVGTDFERRKARTYREAIFGDRHYTAFVYGRRRAQVSQANLPLHGIVIDGQMAVSSEVVRLVEPIEAKALAQERGQTFEEICGVSGQAADARNQLVAADVGGEIKFFCGMDHARWVSRRLALAESGANGGYGTLATAANTAWTHGPKNLLYLRANFPDDLTEPISEALAYRVMDNVNAFYTSNSFNVTSLRPVVTPLLTLPQTKGWYSTAGPGSLISDARRVARAAGFETANYHLDIVAFTPVPDYDWGGLAAVHGKSVWLQSTGAGVTDHELGHNYGLWHANYWIATNSIIGVGTNDEYGNIFDTMGPAGGGNFQFNAPHKNILDWLPDPAVQYVASNGVYRIYPFDSVRREDGRYYAAKVVKDYARDYWIEFRNKFAGNPWLQNGVLLDWAPWEQSNGGTHLLDSTPGTVTRDDSAVVIGRTFSDPAAGVHITPLARGASDTEPWMDVQVTLGHTVGNWSPFLSVEVDPTNAASGQLVHFHATAEDLDGDTLAYAWTFDDGTFSTNNQPWTSKSWSAAGEHVVRCEVSDLRGGRASANTIVTVGQPVGFRLTGVVLDANDDPIEDVRVDNGNTNLAGYVSSYTDSDGVFVITSVNGDLTLEANKYGYTFTNLTWQNPLSVTSNLTRVDFLATALPTVRITASTNAVPESDTASRNFTLTRSGEITNDLAVTLYLSGTATLGGDYTISPTLNALTTNLVTIPTGTQSVSFAFQVLNDTSGEPVEAFTLTIVDSADHVVASPGAATVTILDDDGGVPSVSVTSVTPMVPENGMDRGTFLLTRSGNTQGDLPVFYSASGTATPGVDYGSLVGMALIPAGRQTAIVQFRPGDDKTFEPDETVVLTLISDPSYTLTGSAAQVLILDDDLLMLTVFPAGDAAESASPGAFIVKREGDLTANLVVHYTVSGTANNGDDFMPLSGSVTVPANANSASVAVTPLDDGLLEGDETVTLTLTTNIAYDIGTPGAAKLLLRDNELVSVSVTAPDDEVSEPGENTGSFRISRGAVTSGDLVVNLAISGTATPGVDYIPLENPVVIPDGRSFVQFDVVAFDDLHFEPEETVIVGILPGTNYNVGSPGTAAVTIQDDDNGVPAVGFTSTTSSAPESQSPGISVSLSATSSSPVSVEYVVIGGTASANDFTITAPPLVFEPGQRALSIPITIVNDTEVEPNETIRLALFNPDGATLDGLKIHTYTIVDDDTAAVSVTATVSGITEGGPPGNFRLTRSGATNAALQVILELTGTASAPADYDSPGTPILIPAGATFVDLPVNAREDGTVEPAETVRLTLLNASPGAKIVSPNVATITISDQNTDALPAVMVTSTNQPFAVEGGGNGEFVLTRSGPATNTLAVHFTLGGTATPNVDYAALPAFVVFGVGESSVVLPVVPVDDGLIEGEETVILSLTVTNSYRVAHPSAATVTLQDNDQRVWLDASDFDAAEPDNVGGFTFTRFGTTNTAVRVFFTIGGTAGNGVDFAALSNSFLIPAGSLSATLPVLPLDDSLVEGPETVTLALQGNAAYALGAPTTATVILMDDEPMVSIVAGPTNVLEGGQSPAVFTVRRGGNPDYEFTARLAVSGTANYGVDYPPFATNVFFTCGVTAIDLWVSPTNELVVEPLETITASLLPDSAYTILAPSNAVIFIEDAATNLAPLVRITSPTADLVYLPGTNVNLILESVVSAPDTNQPVTLTWTNLSGPAPVAFGNTDQTNTTVSFTNGGVYLVRVTADHGSLSAFAEVTVVVDAPARLTTNLLHWTFDEGAGTNVFDTSGQGRHGVILGAANWTTNGAVGGALELTGTNNFVRELHDSALLNGLKQFSLALWLKPAESNTTHGIFTADETGANPTWTLSARSGAACGLSSNVVEASFVTLRSQASRVSADNTTTNGWQHLTLTWTNGLAPALYLNGQLDQPQKQMVALRGIITNCPQFVLGKGAADILASFRGLVDDVRVFPRTLSAPEVGALVATNFGPRIEVATNLTVQILTPVELSGLVTDDARPAPPGAVSNTWTQVSGPLPLTITNFNQLTNIIEFSLAGDYVFRLMADDGQVKVYQDLPVTVVEPTQVTVSATDGEAAELGPDPGEFTFSRSGDLNFDLTIYVTLTGAASNGADYVFLPSTNVVILPAGTQSVSMVVWPFLDDRTEGDETVTYTILSNVAYTTVSGTATVTVHDSPYGQWNVEHFTLEELTDPILSGPGADFDHDGRGNFAEYAANLNPKGSETNGPLVTTIELNPDDSLPHITLRYQRRLPPTDTAYAVFVSHDLLTWETGPNWVQEVSVTDDGNLLTETAQSRLVAPFSPSTNTFIRLGVWLLTTGP